MKICITASGDNLDAQINLRFGRCDYFIIWDDEKRAFEVTKNPNIDAGSGAGIQSAQLVVAKGVSVVITGQIGPKAEKILQDVNVRVISVMNGSIKEIIEKYGNDKINLMQT